MRIFVSAALAACALFSAAGAGAICGRSHRHASAVAPDLPPGAVPGECYAKVVTPAQYRDVVEQVTKREASETVRIIPAVYETRSEEVLVRPATTRTEDVAAQYQMVDRQVEVEPARTEWRTGKCNPKAIVDNATGECWCLVEVPPVMKTVQERVVAVPATTRTIDVPAVYETVKKRVLVEAEREERTPVPAVIENVTRRELVSAETSAWVKIPCEASTEKAHVHSGNEMLSFTRLGNRVH